ncbi:XrtN system VIT domain-containing protein [Leptospira gomenensis]|uniref:XrtN system VIT domain-containing protein n=1 Tax=Leptospira gomenensis TaxID=2484974 RepID=A0A5F1YIF9_9LEPT|nr:XrtN system VIT domain-containing protein [Leptospira gomenensis]TGK34530.1 XrtN system VIT domain-containing protein [Leptospira gomenensis]TGK40160.1 XrtN system VIT domain-containing protein [Leptospira gomenensis]TGK41915.1 XrtN system VIT domain-containing protein [Leptospira gomenensis]TGK55669.1 XrtN system VIT domain-containing protein [Leptospira gomenensis]
MTIRNKFSDYFQREVKLLRWSLPAYLWFLILIPSLVLTIAFSAGIWYSGFLHLQTYFGAASELLVYPFFITVGFLLLSLSCFLLYTLFPNYKFFLAFTLVVSAICFATNSYVLNHEVFPPFTERTVWSLWISYAVLTASFWKERIPKTILLFFQPILTLGMFLSLSFVLVLAPLMLFSWMLVWMAGLGFLPYGPLFAITAFGVSIYKIHVSLDEVGKKISTASVVLSLVLLFGYAAYYFKEWKHAEKVLTKQEISQGHNRVDEDLPEWVQKAARLRANHVTEMVLQPNRRSEIALFSAQSQFDPLACLASMGINLFSRSSDERVTPEESGKILHLLFGRSHAYLERLWRGNSLITTDMDSHVQIHPELRTAYTETTISVYNENSETSRPLFGFGAGIPGNEEAIYTITVPEGSVCTKLSLWIDGEEREARLTFKSNARNAYEQIVGTERRDPSYVEWLDGNRLRLRVFPVAPQNYRMVRIGIVSPLRSDGKKLNYERIRLDGPVDAFLEQNVNVDLFSKEPIELDSTGISLKEKTVSDSQVRQWTGNAGSQEWSFSLPTIEPKGYINSLGMTYNVLPERRESTEFTPDRIVVVLNSAFSRARWKEIVSKLYDFEIPVVIVTNEWFRTADAAKAARYLDECEIPAFNLFPLNLSSDIVGNDPVWVVAGEKKSIPLGELRGSRRFNEIQTAASERTEPWKIAFLNGKRSEYAASLIDLHQATPIANGEEELIEALRNRRISLTVEKNGLVSLPYAGITLEKTNTKKGERPGSDLLIRMLIQKNIMKKLGKRFFDRDLDNADLVEAARDAMAVTPVSSLIVLETEKDYRRFGIKAAKSALGQSKLETPGAVPEPEEWLLLVCIVLGLSVYFRSRRAFA